MIEPEGAHTTPPEILLRSSPIHWGESHDGWSWMLISPIRKDPNGMRRDSSVEEGSLRGCVVLSPHEGKILRDVCRCDGRR
ncbi:hypothetical protein LINPERPRIM_LOCUS22602, partial [Linum perenne]